MSSLKPKIDTPLKSKKENYQYYLDIRLDGISSSYSGTSYTKDGIISVSFPQSSGKATNSTSPGLSFTRISGRDYLNVESLLPTGSGITWVDLEAANRNDNAQKEISEAIDNGLDKADPERILAGVAKARKWRFVRIEADGDKTFRAVVGKRTLLDMLGLTNRWPSKKELKSLPGGKRTSIEVDVREDYLTSLSLRSAAGDISLTLENATSAFAVELPNANNTIGLFSPDQQSLFDEGGRYGNANRQYRGFSNQLRVQSQTWQEANDRDNVNSLYGDAGSAGLIGNGRNGTDQSRNGQNGGILFGNGGNGFSPAVGNGGNGGNGGLFGGDGGRGGNGGIGGNGGNGGSSGAFAWFGNGGHGGHGGIGVTGSTGPAGSTGSGGGIGQLGGAGGVGGNGGSAGLFSLFGRGGNAGNGGQGGKGGKGGNGGTGAIGGGRGGQGGLGGPGGSPGGLAGSPGKGGIFGANGASASSGLSGLPGDGGDGGSGGDGNAKSPKGGEGGAGGAASGAGGNAGNQGNSGKDYAVPSDEGGGNGGGGGGDSSPSTFTVIEQLSGSNITYSFGGNATGLISLVSNTAPYNGTTHNYDYTLNFSRAGLTSSRLFSGSSASIGIQLDSNSTQFSASGFGSSGNSPTEGVTITGSASADEITGSAYKDNLAGGAGADNLKGGDGDDLLLYNTGDVGAGEVIDGGNGTNTIRVVTSTDFSNLATATILAAGKVQNIQVNDGQVATFLGSQLSGQLISVNRTTVGVGPATLDINVVGATSVDLSQLAFAATGTGAAFVSGVDIILVDGDDAANIITGPNSDSQINGNAGDDIITAGLGTDTINAGSGSNQINNAGWTRGGYESIIHNSPGSTVTINVTGSNGVTINASQPGASVIASDGGLRNIFANGSTAPVSLNASSLSQSSYNAVLAGGSANDSITGGAGSDVLTGNGGADHFGTGNNFGAAGTSVSASATTFTAAGLVAGETITFATGFAGAVDRITDFVSGLDKLDVVNANTAPSSLIGFGAGALTNNITFVVYGEYDSATGVFTTSASYVGTDIDALLVTGDGVLTKANSTGYQVLQGLNRALDASDFV